MSTSLTDRLDWTFQITDSALKEAADKKVAYHQEHEDRWSDELERIEAEVRESGVKLEEIAVTGGNQFRAIIDPHLSAKLSEAKSKQEYHENKIKEYARWSRAFSLGNTTRWLKYSDLEYFDL